MKPLKYYYHTFFKNNNTQNASIKTKDIASSFNYLQERMFQKERLFFVRFGDGEFVTMLKKDHRNYVYNKKLDVEIEESFKIKDENYLISIPINYPYDEFHASGIYKQFSWQQDMVDLIQQKKFDTNFVFENPCIFQCMAVFKPKKMKSFLEEHVRNKTKMFIGSTQKEVAEKLYGKIDYYVKIPSKHAYENIDSWWSKIEENCKNVDLIIPSAGSSSNVIAKRLWNMNINVKLLDLGSIVDAADYKETRSWIRLQGHKVLKILEPKPVFTTKQNVIFLLKDIKFFFRNQFM